MGLGSGERGAKRVCMRLHEAAFSRHEQLGSYLSQSDAARVAIVRDGNVMLMGLPKSVQTFEEIVCFVESSILRALEKARVLVITFDNPLHVPDTKSATQSKRDSVSKSDQRMQLAVEEFLTQFPDGASAQKMNGVLNCHLLIKSRRTRYVLFDAIMKDVVRRVQKWNVQEDAHGMALLIEGIDLRGAHRPLDPQSIIEKRMVTHAMINRSAFDHMGWDVPTLMSNIGEADLKLRSYARAFCQHPQLYDVVLLETIDTDIMPIMMLEMCHNDASLRHLLSLRPCENGSSSHNSSIQSLRSLFFAGQEVEEAPKEEMHVETVVEETTTEEAVGQALYDTFACSVNIPTYDNVDVPEDMIMGDTPVDDLLQESDSTAIVNHAQSSDAQEAPEAPEEAGPSEPSEDSTRVRVVIAMKERGAYACNQLAMSMRSQGKLPYSSSQAGWLMIDVHTLASELLSAARGISDATQARVFLHLICYGWAVDGCDFVTPAYSDVEPLMDSFASLFRSPMGKRQQKLQSIVDTVPSEDTAQMLKTLTYNAYSNRFFDEQRVRRALWTILYWRSDKNLWPAPETYTFKTDA